MKTHDEIKRGLKCYFSVVECSKYDGCDECPYNIYTTSEIEGDIPISDALACIQQLEQDNAQKDECIRRLELRLGDAVAMLRRFDCLTCYHSNMKHLASVCSTCVNHNKWSWREDGREGGTP